MARFFDTLRDPTEGEELLDQSYGLLDDPKTEFDESSAIDYRAEYNNLPLITAANEAEAGYLVQSGFIEGEKNEQGLRTFVAPSRRMSERLAQREQLRQAARKKLYQEQQNSTLFKIGDTLADTGRLFMSPIFWLSGEDTTKYDPSAQRDAKYRAAFDAHEQFQSALYDKLVQNRMQRIKYARDLRTADITDSKNVRELNAPLSSGEKELFDYATATNQIDLYNQKTPEAYNTLSQSLRLSKGTAVNWLNRVVDKEEFSDVKDIATRYQAASRPITEAFRGYAQAKRGLRAGTGIGDVAAITGFMKALDPGSVVRESEFAIASSASGAYDRITNLIEEIRTGKRLGEEARPQLDALLDELIADWVIYANDRYAGADSRIRAYQTFKDDAAVQNLLGSGIKDPRTGFTPMGPGNPPPGGGTGTIVIDDNSEEKALLDKFGGTAD